MRGRGKEKCRHDLPCIPIKERNVTGGSNVVTVGTIPAARTLMLTFADTYCDDRKCSPELFTEKVFTECLHRRAIPLVALLKFFQREYFLIDWELVQASADATDLAQVRREVREYLMDSRNQGWWRRRANLRLSTGRLLQLAERYLPAEGGPPSGPA
jgi:hypothetical protein